MIKNLLKQIWNERKSNIWLWAELLCVFVFLWYIVDTVYTTAKVYYEPVGFDITDTYMISFRSKTDKTPDFIPAGTKTTTEGEDLLAIVDRIKRLPEVEAVSLSVNARPYTGSNSGFRFTTDTLTYTVLKRPVTPDFFTVFRYENAEESEGISLVDALRDKNIVVSENLLPQHYKGDRRLMQRVLAEADDSTQTYHIAAVTKKVRYNDFWPNYQDKYAAFGMTEKEIAGMGNASWLEVCVRVKPGTTDFVERIMETSDTQFSVGNLFILKVESFDDIRRNFQISSYNSVKTDLWMLAFLLINIFLGIIGTFWFRTQHRRSEMGLRIAVGATRKSLWNMLTNEGLLLLVIATIPAIIICYVVGLSELVNKWQISWSWDRFLIGITITFILIAFMIILGIWYPARQAMHIQPADALHDE